MFGTLDADFRSSRLVALDGTDGFRIEGRRSSDQAGETVPRSGDFNGDGFADLLVWAPQYGYVHGVSAYVGRVYMLFGRRSLPPCIARMMLSTS